jgi:hypothetical protein
MKREIIQASLSAAVAVMIIATPASAAVRAVVGEPLVEANRLLRDGHYLGATAWVDKAAAVPNKTADERMVIAQFRKFIQTKTKCMTQSVNGSVNGCNRR